MRDDWQLEPYDPKIIHRKSTDERGHSFYARVRFPDWWSGMIEEFVASKDFPEYRSISDFIRDAVYHRLRFWEKQVEAGRILSPELTKELKREEVTQKLVNAEKRSEAYNAFMQHLEDGATALSSHADWVGLTKLINELDDSAREAFDDPYLDQVLERLTYWRKRADRY